MDEFGSISIGGDLPEELLEKFRAALVQDCYNLTDKDFHPITRWVSKNKHDIRFGQFSIHEHTDNGEFSNTEEFCRKHGLLYYRKSDATDEYEAIVSVNFPKGTPKKLFPNPVLGLKGETPFWEYACDREGNYQFRAEDLMWLKKAILEVTFKNAPTYVNHKRQIVQDYAKALLTGTELEFLKNYLVENIDPMPPELPPFRIVKGKNDQRNPIR